jgi:hypothetical protein
MFDGSLNLLFSRNLVISYFQEKVIEVVSFVGNFMRDSIRFLFDFLKNPK